MTRRNSPIEDYALIGNSQSAALVGKDGSIDWLCLPRFDSPSCFSALLGSPEHGRWKLAPPGWEARVSRRYRPGTLVLESEWRCPDGSRAVVIDCMVPGIPVPVLIRDVRGLEGRMTFESELVLRFDYGSIVPWVRRLHAGRDGAHGRLRHGMMAIGGPDTVRIHSSVEMRGADFHTFSRFEVAAGESHSFVMSWNPSHEDAASVLPGIAAILGDPDAAVEEAARFWREWSGRSTYRGPWKEAVERSLLTLKALTHAPSGGIVAAPTTSLPEAPGGVRNWDYRFCWVRDATFTLDALAEAGYHEEAHAWRDWLLRAVAGMPKDLSIMYGVSGERRLTELELPWLPGYEGSRPVRIGNAAHHQQQLDVYGEVLDTFHLSLKLDRSEARGEADEYAWRMQRKIISYLEEAWERPDSGIWEVRGPPRHFTHSKVMAWVALDRAIRSVESHGLDGPLERWRELRSRIHAQVCREGFDARKGAFTQYYGSRELDASLLLIPLVGFLPASDPRVRSTAEAIGRELDDDGFIVRYRADGGEAMHVDGLPPGEGAFLACTFWYADNLHLLGREREARAILERLLSIRNDVGLLPEEYDPANRRFTGNFPQAFSHVALINCATNLSATEQGPAITRGGEAA